MEDYQFVIKNPLDDMFLVFNHNDILHGPENRQCLDYVNMTTKSTTNEYDSCCNHYSAVNKFKELEFIIVGYNQLGVMGVEFPLGKLSCSDIGM